LKTKEELLKKLKRDLEIRRYSAATIKRYLYVTSLFLGFYKGKNLDELNEEDAIQYLDYLTKVRYYKASSYNNVNAIIKFFLEVTLNKNIGYRRLPNAKLEVREKVIPSREDIIKIIESTDNLQHKCWFSLAYGSGLRTCEIAKLKVNGIDSKNMKIHVMGKGNKERITVLPNTTLLLLREYCKENRISKADIDEYLFEGKRSEFISEASIQNSLRKVVSGLNINQKITMHSLRRSFATHLLREGVEIEVVKELMGHNSITTTSSYMRVVYDEKELKNPLDSESYGIYNSTDI
jgi:site-specific recombinase XerD